MFEFKKSNNNTAVNNTNNTNNNAAKKKEPTFCEALVDGLTWVAVMAVAGSATVLAGKTLKNAWEFDDDMDKKYNK